MEPLKILFCFGVFLVCHMTKQICDDIQCSCEKNVTLMNIMASRKPLADVLIFI